MITFKGLPIRALYGKLDALSYLDPQCSQLCHQISQVLASLPKSGMIEGPSFIALVGLVQMLMNVSDVRNSNDIRSPAQDSSNQLALESDDDDRVGNTGADEDDEVYDADQSNVGSPVPSPPAAPHGSGKDSSFCF